MSGRNFGVRIPIGAALVAAVLLVTAFDARGGAIRIGAFVAALVGVAALVEYLRMTGVLTRVAGRAALLAGAFALVGRAACGAATSPVVALIFATGALAMPLIASVVRRRRTKVEPSDLQDLGLATLGLVIVVLPVMALIETGFLAPRGFALRDCGFFSLGGGPISENGVGPWLLLVTLFTSKLNDIGGYLVGSLVGRTPLAPGVSPKKSVEGALAGLLLGTFFAWWCFTSFCPTAGVLSPARAIAFGVVVSAATQFGDLGESLIKRAAGVKDSSALIPAFGGIFDLVDSFILAAPAGYTLLRLWSAP